VTALRRVPWADALKGWLVLFLLLSTWAIAQPRYASPDEPAHAQKAYGTATGQWTGSEVEGFASNIREFDGPLTLGPGNITCFVGEPDVPASCAIIGNDPLISTAALYPPYYYATVGVPARIMRAGDSVTTMRLWSAAWSALALTVAVLLLRRSRWSQRVVLLMVALTPMGMSLMGAINPNGLETALLILIWVLGLRLTTDDVPAQHLALALGVTAAAVVMMRPTSVLLLTPTLVVTAIAAPGGALTRLRRRDLIIRMGTPVAIGALLAAAWWQITAFEVSDERNPSVGSFWEAMDRTRLDLPNFGRQLIGVLGWLDTALPWWTYALWAVAVVGVMAMVVRYGARRQVLALLVLVASILALPFVVNGATQAAAGLSFQGRYALGLFAGIAVLGMSTPRTAPRWCIGATVTAVLVADVFAFWQMLRRFSVGASGPWWMTGDLPWSPRIAPMPLVVIHAVTLAVGAVWLVRPSGATVPGRRDLARRDVETGAGEQDGEGAHHGAHGGAEIG
jgi:hypothetical protein